MEVEEDGILVSRYRGLEATTNVHGTIKAGTDTRNNSKNGREEMENMTGSRSRNPLIILGGGRQNAAENMESGVTDDGILNERVGRALREFFAELVPW